MKRLRIFALLLCSALMVSSTSCRQVKEISDSDFRYRALLNESTNLGKVRLSLDSIPKFVLRDFRIHYSGIESSNLTPNNTCTWIEGWPGSQLAFWAETQKGNFLVVHTVRDVVNMNLYLKKPMHQAIAIRLTLLDHKFGEPDLFGIVRILLREYSKISVN